MANKHMKIGSTSLDVKEVKLKPQCYITILTRMAVIMRKTISIGKDVDK